jgi:hypothetical protein
MGVVRLFIVAEMIGVLSSLCKLKTTDLEENPTASEAIEEGEGVVIRKIQNPLEIYKEHLMYCVAMKGGDYQVGWILNDAVSECMICGEPFTLLVTRHHCRSCGCLTCDECCTQRVRISQLPGRKCRVCDLCGVKHVDGEEWDLSKGLSRKIQQQAVVGDREMKGEKRPESADKIDLFSDV